jgi:phenylalanyl-tRNA synthetase alpha chain
MIDKIKETLASVSTFEAKSKEEIESFRIKYLGKKGILNDFFAAFKEVPPQDKKAYGQALNELKNAVSDKVKNLQLEQKSTAAQHNYGDLSKPGFPINSGARHPLSLVKNTIVEIFSQIGFSISEGPEIEDDWHNFTALNLPEYHPARDMQDTFFIQTDPDILLRTHTSSVQVRFMENNQPPIRTISPGRVFRNEAISARSHCIFHQVEGLYIDKQVSFADLKQTLLYFTKALFGKSKIRLRPSYFPFTEPSAEVDIYWGLETETDYRITKGTGWLEIMGCGMVDPNVLKNCNIDPDKYTGYAFGMGIERIAMLLYQIGDIRLFFENDIRFLSQFK